MKTKIPPGFTLIKKGRMQFLSCNAINRIPGFVQAFSTRKGGFSKKPFDSLNVGKHTEDSRKNINKNIKLIENVFNIQYITAARQVHGEKILVLKGMGNRGWGMANLKKILNTEADGLITNVPGLAIGIRVADCVGTIIIDTENKVVAAIHSGWRGVACKIPAKAVRLMKSKFKSNPAKLIAAISPAIGPCHYEVGKEVYKLQKQAVFSNIFTKRKGRVYMNLWKGVNNLLVAQGLKTKNIHVCNMCTYDDPGLFFSHRRDKGRTGRMLSFGLINKTQNS